MPADKLVKLNYNKTKSMNGLNHAPSSIQLPRGDDIELHRPVAEQRVRQQDSVIVMKVEINKSGMVN